MANTFKRTPDVFVGKMTRGGRFLKLVGEYSFNKKIFKFNQLSEVYTFIDNIVQKGAHDIRFGFYEPYKGDTCSAYVYYRGKRGALNFKDFKLFPRDISDTVNEYIKKVTKK